MKQSMDSKHPIIYTLCENDTNTFIEKYFIHDEVYKKMYGEVFTPQPLIYNMLNAMPKDVWKNPNLKWLEPSCGIGNIMIYVFHKLNIGLQSLSQFKDETKRKEHIIQNMLYMIEINDKNVKVLKQIFGKDANIYKGDFLHTEKWMNKFGFGQDSNQDSTFVSRPFDIIIGNPPFQQKQEHKIRRGGYGKKKLWNTFIDVSLDILKQNGYLVFITPPNWRGVGESHYIFDLFQRRHLLYLHMYGEKDGKKYFNAQTRFDIYVVKNTIFKTKSVNIPIKNTTVIDTKGNTHILNIQEYPFLPNFGFTMLKQIVANPKKKNGISVIYNRSEYSSDSKDVSSHKDENFKYPIVHSINKKGVHYIYSNKKKGVHFNEPKVILSFGRYQYSYPQLNDYKGEYGMSQICFGIPIQSKDNGMKLLKAIQTQRFKEFIESIKWGAFQTNYRVFQYIKKDFYTYFLKQKKSNRKITKKSRQHIMGNKTLKN